MLMRRSFIIAGVALILFLAVYSWNRRTSALDEIAAYVGLEISGTVLEPLRAIESAVGGIWERYFDLVDVREENIRLQATVQKLETQLASQAEDLAELKRLRALVQFPADARWRPLAARVLAGKLGPNAVLESILISRGYGNGARPGVPLATHKGLVGRVLRSSAHASTALLITDPGSHVAVFGQESRASGILKGKGMGAELELDFVPRDATLKAGEVLITSGLDDKYPKGLPVAVVNSVAPSDYTQFMAVTATPLVDLQHLEEVLLLEETDVDSPVDGPEFEDPGFMGPPAPLHLSDFRQTAAAPTEADPLPEPDRQKEKMAVRAGDGAHEPPRTATVQAPRFRIVTP